MPNRLRSGCQKAFAARPRVPIIIMALPLLVVGSSLWAQGPPPSPVRYTEAREHAIQKTLRLPATVESPTSSLVASEVAGRVAGLPAREGNVVRKGQTLAVLDTSTLQIRLEASEAALKEAQARQKQAERSLARARELFESKVTSQQQLDDAIYEYDAREGRVEALEADIHQIRHDLDRSAVRAPFAGTVVSERTEVGEWLDVGGPVVELVSLEELEARVEVPERYFQNLNPGAAATVSFESLSGYTVTGRVTAIVPRADAKARTFPVKVRIRNKEGRIGVGMLAQVELPAGESYRATVVPKDAVIQEGTQRVVYLIKNDNTVDRVAVETGAGLGAWVAVEGPIRAGQKVITRGNERVRPGQAVKGEKQEYRLP